MNARRAGTLLAPDRVRLYLSLVPYLAERGQVSVAEAAADFDVTEATMRTMVQKLTVIGLPGEDGYWQLDQDLFNINWDLLEHEDVIELTNTVALRRAPRLTAREAAALLSGLRLAQAVPGVDDDGTVTALIAKLAHGASGAPADVIVAPAAADEVRRVVAAALKQHRAVSFTYRVPDAAPTIRTVDPVKVHVANGQWYLQGWCHLRRAMRTFNLERVSDASVTERPNLHGADEVPELFAMSEAAPVVTVEVATELAPALGDYLSAAGSVDAGGTTTARLRLGDPRSVKRLATRFGGELTVLAPAESRAAAVEWAAAALAQYG